MGANQCMIAYSGRPAALISPRQPSVLLDGAGLRNTINDASRLPESDSALLIVFRFSYNTRWNASNSLEKERFDLSALQSMGWSQNYYSPVAVFPALTVSGPFQGRRLREQQADDGDSYYFDDDLSWNRAARMHFGSLWPSDSA